MITETMDNNEYPCGATVLLCLRADEFAIC
jgi:hypothetical protein